MIRAVLDTNIVISAALRADGLPAAVLSLAIDGVIELCVSEPILAEYKEVLGRGRLAIPPGKVANALARIREKSSLMIVTVDVPADTCPNDPDDLMFLECAETATAHYLVTGNRKHFTDDWKTTRVVTARRFMGIVATIQSADPP